MKIYIALVQPDGDWDHQADFLGAYSSLKLAEDALRGMRDTCEIYAVDIDARVTLDNTRSFIVKG